MVINSYNVAMGASRKSNSTYSTEVETSSKQKGSNITSKSNYKDVLTISEEAREYLTQSRDNFKGVDGNYDFENKYKNSKLDNSEENTSEESKSEENKSEGNNGLIALNATNSTNSTNSFGIEDAQTLKLRTLLKILEALTKNTKSYKLNASYSDNFLEQLSSLNDSIKKLKVQSDYSINANSSNVININSAQTNNRVNANTSVWQIERKTSVFVKEEEVTNFSSTGYVKTADGRNISFNINLELSRRFQEEFKTYTSEEVILQDPLVINLNSAPANISDQTFYFDIDSDGSKEEISQLGKGSGFLALDKNEDGQINDGNELFGATTGNGFAELSKYDDDENGWIDEADEVFKKLKVWTKDDDGKDVLLSLKDAGVGAIYLNNVSTEFSSKNMDNEINAQIRSSGVYLKENGEVGSIQQVDFAIKNKSYIQS